MLAEEKLILIAVLSLCSVIEIPHVFILSVNLLTFATCQTKLHALQILCLLSSLFQYWYRLSLSNLCNFTPAMKKFINLVPTQASTCCSLWVDTELNSHFSEFSCCIAFWKKSIDGAVLWHCGASMAVFLVHGGTGVKFQTLQQFA